MLTGLVRSVARRLGPRIVNHTLTDAPVVRELRRASGREALVAVYDDGTAAHATPETLERELGVSLPPDREVRLPAIPRQSFAPVRRTVRARTLADADPPVVLVSRRSLEEWDEATRDFVLAHEFGHLRAGGRVADQILASLLPAPNRSALAIRALAEARDEYRAGEAHAELRADLPEHVRTPVAVMAEYHAAERPTRQSDEQRGETVGLLGADERTAVAIRNAAKYAPLPYDPPEIRAEVETALAGPLQRYINLVAEGVENGETSA